MQSLDRTDDIARLQACLNDLVSLLALPALWRGRDPPQIAKTLVEVLLGSLRLDLVYVRLGSTDRGPFEIMHVSRGAPVREDDATAAMQRFLGQDPDGWRPQALDVGGQVVSIVPLRLGLESAVDVLVAGARRPTFPEQTENLLLSVAATQATIALHEADLRMRQRALAEELDRRVAQRTLELAAANDDLQRGAAFLAEAQRLSSTGSFSWYPLLDRITWSDQLYRIFGFDESMPVTLERIASRLHPEDVGVFVEAAERARSDGGDLEFAHRLLMPDGSVKHLHLVAHGSRDRDGALEYIGAVQDVTERHQAAEALGRARSELAHVARVTTLGVLTASIAHEVNQPLSGIVTNASTCLRMLAADPPNVEGARETALRTIRDANRAADVITRLRALFGTKSTAAEAVDLNEAVREVLALTTSELRRHGVAVRTELAVALPTVVGDRVQLQQVVLNLLLNASDAMSSVTDRAREVTITTGADGDDRVQLLVRDAGVGIPGPLLEKLFEPFLTTKRDGMGIGLSISRSIIESHRGVISAANNEGPGATFRFSIPVRAD